MNLKSLVIGGVAAFSLCMALASPAQAAMQRFWVVNFSHLDIYNVYATRDSSGGNRDLMGDNGILNYNPRKVPDLVQVLQPYGNRCRSDIRIIAYPNGSDDEYEAWIYGANLCQPGQTFNIYDDDFGY